MAEKKSTTIQKVKKTQAAKKVKEPKKTQEAVDQTKIESGNLPNTFQAQDVSPQAIGIKAQALSGDDKLRQNVAIGFVFGYFLFIGITFWYSAARNFNYNDSKDLVIVVAGLLNAPLGLVIAYYFRAERDK